MSEVITCPECNAKLVRDLVHCPHCSAFVVDSSPWKRDYNLYAIPLTLLSWWILDLVFRLESMPTHLIFSDPISRTILGLGLYGMIVLCFKLSITLKQVKAFRIVREVCGENSNVSDDTLMLARERIRLAGIGPFNSFIAYHRLEWLVSASKADPAIQMGLLDAQRQHGDTDWDALDGAFSSTQYLVWLLPTVGFLGTVWGMTNALQAFSSVVGSKGSDMAFNASLISTTQSLGVAFYTTLVGLACVIPVLALATFVRRRSQGFLERCDKYFIRLSAIVLQLREDTRPPAAPVPISPMAMEFGAPERTFSGPMASAIGVSPDASPDAAMPSRSGAIRVAPRSPMALTSPDETLDDSNGLATLADIPAPTIVAGADTLEGQETLVQTPPPPDSPKGTPSAPPSATPDTANQQPSQS